MKHSYPQTFFSFALLFCVITIQASTEDSLRNVIASTDGIEKIEAISNLMVLKTGEKDAIDYTFMLEEEARKQNNEEYIGYALLIKASIFANDINSEKFFPAAEEAMAYLLEKKQYNRYFLLYNFVIQIHLNEGYFETAFMKISSMLDETKKYNNLFGEINVYESMGDAYFMEKHSQKALESYRKVFSMLNAHFYEQDIYRAETAIKIAKNAYDTGDIHLALLFCDSAAIIANEIDLSKSGRLENFSTSYIKLLYNAYYALSYISIGKEKEASDAMNKAFLYSEDNIEDNFLQTFYYICSDYYYKKEEYNTALEYIKKNEEIHIYETSPDIDVMLMKSKILAIKGDLEGAYKIEEEYREITDSLNQKRLSQRISELRTIHQVEKLEFEAEQERLKTVNMLMFIVGLTVFVLLLACVIIVIIHNLKKIKRKNRVLYQRIQAQETLELELKRKEDVLHAKLLTTDKSSDDDEADRLYLRLKKLMEDEKNYTDPNVTRKTLATKLGTNEKYLHETITKHLDLSFTEYINLLRLDYAREMICQSINELALEDIAMLSGFGTRQTFHRLFRDRYGLSPSEFSSLLKNS
jgi:AraC-type DNA-binding domain-containing proteins